MLLAVCVTFAARAQQSGTPPGNPMPQNIAYTDSTVFGGSRASLALFFGSSRYFQVPTMRQLTDSLQFRVRFTDTSTVIETRYHAAHTYQLRLVSGTTIKTINGISLLGGGDIVTNALAGTDGSGNILMPDQTAKPIGTAGAIKFYNHSGPAWVAPDGFERSIRWPTATADRFVTLPDSNGTIALLEKSQSWSGTQTYTANPVIKSSTPALSLALSDNTTATISRNSASNTFSITNSATSAGNIGKAITMPTPAVTYGYATDSGLPSGNGAFTVSVWIKTTDAGTPTAGRKILGWGLDNTSGASTGGAFLSLDYTGVVSFNGWQSSNTGMGLAMSSSGVNNGNWQHLVVTYDGLTMKAYCNNILKGTGNWGNINITLKGRFELSPFGGINGYNNTNGGMIGSFDQVLFYNRALSAAEVASIYNGGTGTASVPLNGLLRYYDFDTGSTSTTPNLAPGGANSMALIGNPVVETNGKTPSAGGVVATVNVLTAGNGQAGADNSVTTIGDPLGQSKLQGQFISTLVNSKNPFTIGKDGHARIDPAYVDARNTNGSVNANSVLYLGTGSATVSQLQLASSPTLTASAGLNGSVIFDGTNFAAVTGGQSRTFAFLESPVFTGTPTAQTAPLNTNNTQLATTAFVATALNNLHTGVSSIAGTTDQINMVNNNGAVTLSLPQSINKTSNVIFNSMSLGTNQSDAKLTVNGTIHAKEVKVDTSVPFPDYVFDADYHLKSLNEVKAYINQYHHLPGVPSAEEVEKEGMKLGELNTALLKKVEELTLYLLQQQKEIGKLKSEVHHLKGKHKRKNY